jgi:hypothetical protein
VEAVAPGLVIFTFKKTVEVRFGAIAGSGLISQHSLGGSPIFVMPGPFAARAEVDRRLAELADALRR